MLEISNLKIIVIDDKIAEHLKIDGDTILEQLLVDDGIVMKIKSAIPNFKVDAMHQSTYCSSQQDKKDTVQVNASDMSPTDCTGEA